MPDVEESTSNRREKRERERSVRSSLVIELKARQCPKGRVPQFELAWICLSCILKIVDSKETEGELYILYLALQANGFNGSETIEGTIDRLDGLSFI